MPKMLPIGVSDFRKLVQYKNALGDGYFYIDKTMLIREIIADGSEVIVLPRPRRFGKTLNLSMLNYFFASEVKGKSTAGIFDHLKIAKDTDVMKVQGKYPVIFISFKNQKYSNAKALKNGIIDLMAGLYREHNYLLDSEKIDSEEKVIFKSILEKHATDSDLTQGIYHLSRYLFLYHGIEPYILIDEYDIPIQEAYLNNYYKEAVELIRALFSAALKDNVYITKAVLTGIVRVSKESLFSGLNNISVYSLLDVEYSGYFGFLDEEVDLLLSEYSLNIDRQEIKDWYNGYIFGQDKIIYNPWSILNVVKRGVLQSYWINTSGNGLIKQQIEHATPKLQNKFKQLLQGETITERVTEHLVFQELDKNSSAVWSLLLLTGYLKAVKAKSLGKYHECELAIPNKEIMDFYATTVTEWLARPLGDEWLRQLLKDLTQGNIERFQSGLNRFTMQSTSFYDVAQDKQESFYHGLILGLVAALKDEYTIHSNQESGLGRYDVALIPHDKTKLGIIMEFKRTEKTQSIEKTAEAALAQAITSEYQTVLEQMQITHKMTLGMAFSGKQVAVVAK